jgi:hypothetical protein
MQLASLLFINEETRKSTRKNLCPSHERVRLNDLNLKKTLSYAQFGLPTVGVRSTMPVVLILLNSLVSRLAGFV